MSGIAKKVHKSVLDDLNIKLAENIELKKKLSASDHVNRNLRGMLEKSQERWKQEKKIHQNVTKEHKKSNEKNATLRKLVKELQEGSRGGLGNLGKDPTCISTNQQLETAKKVIDEMNEREERMQNASKELIKKHNNAVNLKDLYEGQLKDVRKEAEEQVQDLNQHNSLLTGELRGANYCFTKLVEVMFEQKGDS